MTSYLLIIYHIKIILYQNTAKFDQLARQPVDLGFDGATKSCLDRYGLKLVQSEIIFILMIKNFQMSTSKSALDPYFYAQFYTYSRDSMGLVSKLALTKKCACPPPLKPDQALSYCVREPFKILTC